MSARAAILFPSDYFDRKAIDPDLKREYESVIRCNQFKTVIFGYREWFDDHTLLLTPEADGETRVIYRGWMMQPDLYRAFEKELGEHQYKLLTPASSYRDLHEFPRVYEMIKEDTAGIMLFPLHERIDIERVKSKFDRFMVKDYVKSVKGTQFPTFFDSSVTQDEFDAQMEVFYQFRGSLLTGGICVKEYLDLRRYDGHTNEWRAFYFMDDLISLCRNSNQRNYVPEPPASLVKKYRLPSPFYTIDFAELANGTWKIIEVGDGGVSGLSEGQDHDAYFRALYHCLR